MFKCSRGFTLVELLVVLAVLGIITAIAVPVYRGYTATARCEQVVGPVHSTMVALVGDFAENGTAAPSGGSSTGSPPALTINGRTYEYPASVSISYSRAASPDNRYTVTGHRTDGVTCPGAAGTYTLVEGETEGQW